MKAKLLSFLNFLFIGKDNTPFKLTISISLGLLVGFTPTFLCLQNLLVILALIFFRISLRLFIIFLAISYLLGALLLDPLFNSLGLFILNLSVLKPIWTLFYQWPIIPFSRFNNSVVMGAIVVSIILFPLVYILTRFLKKKNNKK